MNSTHPTTATWRKSSRSSQTGQCVEMAVLDGPVIAVRDSKDPDGPVLRFTEDQWRSFLAVLGH